MTSQPGSAAPWARFDDLVAGTGLVFRTPHRVLVADCAADVAAVLREVDQATRQGAWAFGYLAYEAAAGLDPGLAVCARPSQAPPLVWFGVTSEPERVPALAPDTVAPPAATTWQPSWSDERYRADVARVREHIAAGDTYQCNLTVRLRSPLPPDLLQLYAGLVHNQRTPYGAYLDLGRHVVASASPELFFRWEGNELLTRPMKGTATRGRTPAEDEQQRRELLGSAKERAENVIVVDLLRNDVGRVAVVGSVQVPALCVPERYDTVWQLTSDVTGTLAEHTSLLDIFRALFPSGSVTGAPKYRAMQIIRDLEDDPRGVYCGAIGLVAPPGAPLRAQFSVAIRTVAADRLTRTAVYGTGGGITWSSDAAAELAEVHAKAAILSASHREFELLETMAYLPATGVRNLERHLDRLASSARYFGFSFDIERARAQIATRTEAAGAARVRVSLGRTGALQVALDPLPAPPTGPVTLAIDPRPVDSGSRWLYHKTSHRDAYTSRARRHPYADDVVLINERGELTETTIANLAVRLDGTWWTPPLDAGCLPGVERGRLLELGLLQERVLSPHDLGRAEALAVVSSLRRWRPAVLATRRR